MSRKYNIVSIGSGFGGYGAACKAAALGYRVALVEKNIVGGECCSFGCIPTKAMLKSIETYNIARNASEMGIDIKGDIRADFSKVSARRDKVVKGIVDRVHVLLRNLKIDFYEGVGAITNPREVRVKLNKPGPRGETEVFLETDNIVIGTGSNPERLNIPGSNLPGVLTNREVLKVDHLPRSIVIMGASYVGVEFASIFATLGSQVSLMGRKNFLKGCDRKLAERVHESMSQDLGIKIDIGLDFLEIQETGEGLYRVLYEKDGVQQYAEGEIVLMATGRTPYTQNLFGKDLRIDMDGDAILVNEYMKTSIDNIYAVGDVLNRVMLAFTAVTEGEVAVDNCIGKRVAMDYSVIPRCVFTHLELADVGLTEEEAGLIDGLEYGVAEYPFNTTPMAEIMNRTQGLTRLLYEKGTGIILGGHILGPHASELIAELTLAIRAKLSVQGLAYNLTFHPSLSENLQRAGKTASIMEEIAK